MRSSARTRLRPATKRCALIANIGMCYCLTDLMRMGHHFTETSTIHFPYLRPWTCAHDCITQTLVYRTYKPLRAEVSLIGSIALQTIPSVPIWLGQSEPRLCNSQNYGHVQRATLEIGACVGETNASGQECKRQVIKGCT